MSYKKIIFAFLFVFYFVKIDAQNITVSVASNVVTLTMSGATTVSNFSSALTNSNNTLTITSTISGTLSLSGSPSGVTINNTLKTTTVDLSTFTTFSGIELVGSSGDDVVTIGTGGIVLTSANGGSNQSILINLGTGTDALSVSNALTSKGSGTIQVTVSKNIAISAAIATAGGSITIAANQQGTPSTGNFAGIAISGDITTTGAGNISIQGKGGTTGNGNHGINLNSGKVITALGSGSVTVTGRGGATTGNTNYGVNISGANTKISASGGTVTVTGYGGGTNVTTSGYDFGVCLHNSGGTITNTGTSSGATVTVAGYGGPGAGDSEIGVDNQYIISSSGGNIVVQGTGGANGVSYTSNIGVLLRVAGKIDAGVDGSITLTGTASASQGGSNGVEFQGTSRILTNNGNITVAGTSHSNSYGVTINGGSGNTMTSGGNKNTSITANKYNFPTVSAGTGIVTLKASTGVNIDVAGNDGASTLGLSSTELNGITASRLIIGDSTASSTITVSNSINPSLISGTIDLNTASTLNFTGGTFTTGARTLNIFAGTLSRTSGIIDLSNAAGNIRFKNTSALTLPSGLIGNNTVQNLSVTGAGGIALGDSTVVSGTLSLTGGDLAIASNCLVITGTISAMSSSNSITGGSSSKIRISGSGSNSIGTLYFTAGSATLNTLQLNRSGASGTNPVVNLGTDLTVSGRLELTTGKIALGNNTMTFTGNTIAGGGANSYVQINGSGGFKRAGGSSILFPVGFNPYMPVTLTCSSCGGTDFTVSVASGLTDDNNATISTNMVNATWTMSASTNMTANMTFQWPATQETSMGHTNVVFGTRTGAPGPWTNLGSSFSVGGSDPYTLSYSGFSFASGVSTMFGIGGSGVPLPVKLIDFNSACEELTWKTAGENLQNGYEILGSEQGNNWVSIGVVTASNGGAISQYSFKLKQGLTYGFYKLKIIDNKGAYEYSHVISNACSNYKAKYACYPNPAYELLFIDQMTEDVPVKIFDSLGAVVYESVGQQSIDISHLAPGVYNVLIGEQQIKLVKAQ